MQAAQARWFGRLAASAQVWGSGLGMCLVEVFALGWASRNPNLPEKDEPHFRWGPQSQMYTACH